MLNCKSVLRTVFVLVGCLSPYAVLSAHAQVSQDAEKEDAQELKPAVPEPAKKNGKKVPNAAAKREAKAESATPPSPFFPDWKPASFALIFYPVLGFQYSSDSRTGASTGQAELGAFAGLRGIPLVAGNPGMQIEPSAGIAFGQAAVNPKAGPIQSGNYRRVWGGLQTPIYYKFFRQVFAGRYGVVSGGPIEEARRSLLQSDSGVAVLQNLTAHYTLTLEQARGKDSTKPSLDSWDHWLHARLSANLLNFFVDVGPGYSSSKVTSVEQAGKTEARTSGAYLLGLSGFDLLTDKLGLEAQAKYVFTSQTDVAFDTPSGRSPLEDLGADARRVGLPADSLHASAFFGLKRVLGTFGVGWRYSLEILNVNERNNQKQVKTESNGIGVFAAVRF